MTSRWMWLGCLAAAIGSAGAAPFNAAQVPAPARWVLHVDADQLRSTEMGRALIDKLSTGKGGQKMAALATVLGFDLRRDLAGCTMFGFSEQDGDGVVVMNGRFNTQQLETLVKADDGYKAGTYRSLTVHSWIDRAKKKRMFGAIPDGNTVLIGGSAAALHAAVDVAQRHGPGLDQQNPNQLPLPTLAGATILLAAADVAGLKQAEARPNAQLLRRARSGSLTLREESGQFVGHLLLDAPDANSARLLAEAGRGLLAMAQLNDKADAATLELLQGIQLEQQGLAVSLSLRMPSPKAAVWLRTQIEKDEQKKAAAAAALE